MRHAAFALLLCTVSAAAGAAPVVHRVGGAPDEAATAATTARDGHPVFAFVYEGAPVVDAHGTNLPPANGRDVGVVRYDGATGRALSAWRVGGAGDQVAHAIAADAQGGYTLVGSSTAPGGTSQRWIAALASDGSVRHARTEASTRGAERMLDAALDASGNAYAIGTLGSTGATPALVVTRLDASGTETWRFTIESPAAVAGGAIALTGSGSDARVVVLGSFDASVELRGTSAASAATRAISGGGRDLFVAAYRAADGARLAHALYGTERDDEVAPGALAADAQGRLVFGAYTPASPTQPFFPRGSCTTVASVGLIVLRLAPDLSCDANWAFVSGGGPDTIHDIATSVDGLWLAGAFNGFTDFDPSTTQLRIALNDGPGADPFLVKLANDGRLDFVAPFGDPIGHAGTNAAFALAIDGFGNAWTGGAFRGTVDFAPLEDGLARTAAGGSDAFVARTSGCGSISEDPQLCRLGDARGVSGSFVESVRDGEGFVVEMLGNSRAGLYWYTYPPEGSAARQSWIVGTGRVLSDRIEFDAVTASGPSFGPGYDVSRLVLAPWGRIVIRFTDCNNARLSFAGPAGYGSGARTLLRLTGVDGHTCDGRALRRYDEGVGRGASGSYFEPASAGQGFSVHALPGGGMAISFYTFEPDGTPLWLVGAGGYDGRRAIFDDLVRAEGTPFTPFNGLGVRRSSWGGAVVEFLDCDRARATFTGVTPYGTDVLDAVRLGAIDGVPCPDAPPD
ncbi:MAG TPA: hypothetical protein VFO79_10405 [Xanthomonadales bacterium]|nr:hypothetical protein [Xanthomonadales bacterium]